MGQPGVCRTAPECAPPPPPPLPMGKFERTRFYEEGYRGINKQHLGGKDHVIQNSIR